ncbi:MAG: prolipoprotein diacylglyceryl transferase, partial [Sphingomicrobium sp.]
MTAVIANTADAISYYDLGLSPVALDLGIFELRWYSLGYLAGIFLGYWYLLKLVKQPGAPLARRHADDLVFYASLGVIFGGRLGYVLFYNLSYYLKNPLDILKLWDGGMSFHGGVIGVTIGILYLARKEGLNWLRVHDYVACTVPIGLGLVRIANFVNGELWGAPTNVAWAVRFPEIIGG